MGTVPPNNIARKTQNRLLPSSPLELANLAALLDGKDNLCRNYPNTALTIAARVYVKAVILYEDLTALSEKQLLIHLAGSGQLVHPELRMDDEILAMVFDDIEKTRNKRLYLNEEHLLEAETDGHYANGIDSAREYLSAQSTSFKSKEARSVADNILRYHKSQAKDHNELHGSEIEEAERQRAQITREFAGRLGKAVEELTSDEYSKIHQEQFSRGLLDYEKFRRTGKELHEKFLERHGVKDHVTGRTKYWELSTDFLDRYVKWRLSTKENVLGGVKSFDGLP